MTDPLAAEARRLRVEEQLSVRRSGPGWASAVTGCTRCCAAFRRPSGPAARTPGRAAGRGGAAAADGRSVNEIAEQLGVAKSTAYQWVKHLPLDPDDAAAERRRAHSKLMTDARWAAYREARDAAQAAEQAAGRRSGRFARTSGTCWSSARRSTGVRGASRSRGGRRTDWSSSTATPGCSRCSCVPGQLRDRPGGAALPGAASTSRPMPRRPSAGGRSGWAPR